MITQYKLSIITTVDNSSSSYTYTLIPLINYAQDSHLNTIYNESLQLSDNSQSSLTFSISKMLDGKINPLFSLIHIGTQLQLYFNNKYYEFVITELTPSFGLSNISYSVTCQDSLSFFLSRNNLGATYEDDEDTDPNNYRYTGLDIYQLTLNILSDGNLIDAGTLVGTYKLDSKLRSGSSYQLFPNNQYIESSNYSSASPMKCTISLTDSNTYNALIEVANKFNAILDVTYYADPNKSPLISYKNRSYIASKGYRLSQSSNLSSFSIKEDSSNLLSVMRVFGGTNSNEEAVTLVNDMPDSIKDWIVNTFTNDAVLSALIKEYKNGNPKDDTKCGIKYKILRNSFDTYCAKCYPHEITETEDNYLRMVSFRVTTGTSMLYYFKFLSACNIITEKIRKNIEEILDCDYCFSNMCLTAFSSYYFYWKNKYDSTKDQEEELIMQLAANDTAFIEDLSEQTENGEEKKYLANKDGTLISITAKEYYYSKLQSVIDELQTLYCSEDYMKSHIVFRGKEFYDISKTTSDNSESDELYSSLLTTAQENYSKNISIMNSLLSTIKYVGKLPINDENGKSKNHDEEGTWTFTSDTSNSSLIKTLSSGKVSYNTSSLFHFTSVEGGDTYISFSKFLNCIGNSVSSAYVDYCSYASKNKNILPYLDKTYTRTENGLNVTYTALGYYNWFILMHDFMQTKILYDTANKLDFNSFSDATALEKIKDSCAIIEGINIVTYVNGLAVHHANVYSTSKFDIHGEYGKYDSVQSNIYKNYIYYLKKSQSLYNDLVKKYPQAFIENSYTDEDQITSEGLYESALAQFNTYKEPVLEYSATAVNFSNLIGDSTKYLDIGERIFVTFDNYSNIFDSSQDYIDVEYELNSPITSTYNMTFNGRGISNDKIKFLRAYIENNHYYVLARLFKLDGIPLNSIDPSAIDIIADCNGNIHRVIGCSNVTNRKTIELQITGITRNLRENTTQITVNNNTMIHGLIERMLKIANS